ncbi:MAG: group II intron reverse transcriptase domain-containing protein [Clostridia bacterium]|nr:group II intron reverse transcriptase domain-containing protein [Clostridia bacterium]
MPETENACASLLDKLADAGSWEKFYEYKTSLACPKQFTKELRGFIDRQAYLPVCEKIAAGVPFPLPQRSVVSKMSSQKKRVVYTYPDDENTVLKHLTYLLLRKYDSVLCDNLYSFRPGRTAKDAVRRLTHTPGVREMYAYKADVSNYFNSVPVERLTAMLREILADDPALLRFLTGLLEEPQVLENGVPLTEQKGIMAGTPTSAFFANVYLSSLDRRFSDAGIPYARYSDDIIVLAHSAEEAEAHARTLRDALEALGLSVNPDKEEFGTPESGWVFLGFRYRQGVVDIAPASLTKLKGKMRRKTRALARWRQRNGLDGKKAAGAFIRIFNRKLFESAGDNELTWTRWFFPVLNTDVSLKEIDRYAEDCIRFLASGTRTKARYNVRYRDIKEMGFRSLVHEYYKSKKEECAPGNECARGDACARGGQ